MFDSELERPLPVPSSIIPLDAMGEPDFDPNNWAYHVIGGREIEAYHWNGNINVWESVPLSVLILVLKERLSAGGKKVKLPKTNAEILQRFAHREITELNWRSEHLLLMSDGRVANFAAFSNMKAAGEDPQQNTSKWIHDGKLYKRHHLTTIAGATYTRIENRVGNV